MSGRVEYISLQHGKHVNCSDKILKAYEGQHVESDAKADECAMILLHPVQPDAARA